ncbi:MAG TPA: MOSC domain-containing protein [Verrucomicrobiaceae bacterium]|jgi:MOSC domain-containing protein YiiM
MSASLISLRIGRPRQHGIKGASDPMDKPWTSAFYREENSEPVRVLRDSLEGDAVADPRVHGGPDKAVCCYASEHYPQWQRELSPAEPVAFGAFGENFTTRGLVESEVCIGDTFQVGTAIFQITQPRQPCWKLGRRWRLKQMPALVANSGRTGWYFRVMQTGAIRQGDAIELAARPHSEWTLSRANDVMEQRDDDTASLRSLAACPALSISWRDELEARLRKRQSNLS